MHEHEEREIIDRAPGPPHLYSQGGPRPRAGAGNAVLAVATRKTPASERNFRRSFSKRITMPKLFIESARKSTRRKTANLKL